MRNAAMVAAKDLPAAILVFASHSVALAVDPSDAARKAVQLAPGAHARSAGSGASPPSAKVCAWGGPNGPM